jgi:hypothetical protein
LWRFKKKFKKMKKVCISFSQFPDLKFRKKAEFIHLSLSMTDSYSNLVPSLEVVGASITNYRTALEEAVHRHKFAVSEKNRCRRELEALLKQLGLCVMTQANGDLAMLEKSGYTLYKTPEARYIGSPGHVTLSKGINSGSVVSSVKGVPGCKSYVHEIAMTPPSEETVWKTHTFSKSTYVFENLTPGKEYWVRVAVIGSRGQKAYSNVASWFAQN